MTSSNFERTSLVMEQKAVQFSIRLKSQALGVDTRLLFCIQPSAYMDALQGIRTCVDDLRVRLQDNLLDSPERAPQLDQGHTNLLNAFETKVVTNFDQWTKLVEVWKGDAAKRIAELTRQVEEAKQLARRGAGKNTPRLEAPTFQSPFDDRSRRSFSRQVSCVSSSSPASGGALAVGLRPYERQATLRSQRSSTTSSTQWSAFGSSSSNSGLSNRRPSDAERGRTAATAEFTPLCPAPKEGGPATAASSRQDRLDSKTSQAAAKPHLKSKKKHSTWTRNVTAPAALGATFSHITEEGDEEIAKEEVADFAKREELAVTQQLAVTPRPVSEQPPSTSLTLSRAGSAGTSLPCVDASGFATGASAKSLVTVNDPSSEKSLVTVNDPISETASGSSGKRKSMIRRMISAMTGKSSKVAHAENPGAPSAYSSAHGA